MSLELAKLLAGFVVACTGMMIFGWLAEVVARAAGFPRMANYIRRCFVRGERSRLFDKIGAGLTGHTQLLVRQTRVPDKESSN